MRAEPFCLADFPECSVSQSLGFISAFKGVTSSAGSNSLGEGASER